MRLHIIQTMVLEYIGPVGAIGLVVVTWLITRNRNAQAQLDAVHSNNVVRDNILLDGEMQAQQRRNELEAIESTHRSTGTAGLREQRIAAVARNQLIAEINTTEEGANVARQSDHTMGSTLKDGVLAAANKV